MYEDTQIKNPVKEAAKKRTKGIPAFDWPLAIIVLTLVGFGLVMVFSSSYVNALYRMGDSYTYIRKQVVFAVLGLACMTFFSFMDYHAFHRFAWPIMAVTLLLLVVVLFMPKINDARRWIVIPKVITFQPSDIVKFAVIILFSHIIALNHEKMKTFKYGVLPFILILGVIAGLMLLEPHLSGTILILLIGAILMFVGGTGFVWFGIGVGGIAAAIVGALVLVPGLVPYVQPRIEHWLNPFSNPSKEGYQTIQSMYAISSGKLFGKGIGNSVQKHLYMPEPQNDFIFSITCEELGFVGALIIIGLFVALLLRGLYIAIKAKDKFGSLIVVGVIMQITVQAALNISVVTNLIPNTGISLPFFSAGGTSLTMLMAEIGVVLSVSRQSNIDKV